MKPFWNKYNFPNILEWIKSKTVHLKQNLIIFTLVFTKTKINYIYATPSDYRPYTSHFKTP